MVGRAGPSEQTRDMSRFRWTNPSLPQTLQIAVLFLYISAFFDILNGLVNIVGVAGLIFLLSGIAAFAAAQGTVRERKPGYLLGLLYAAWDVVLRIFFVSGGFSAWHVIGVMLAIALVALLLHPMSRAYYRTWFR